VIAVAVADGNVLPDSFSDEKLVDPRIWDLLAKIKVSADPEIDALFPAVKRARVTITTLEGDSHCAQVDYAKGSPQNPMSDQEIIAKFRANTDGVVSKKRQDEIIAATWSFDQIDDLGEYINLLVQE